MNEWTNCLECIIIDTNIFFSHRNEDYLQNTLNVKLDNVTNWCQANRLSINIKKSKFMIFKPRQKKSRTLT